MKKEKLVYRLSFRMVADFGDMGARACVPFFCIRSHASADQGPKPLSLLNVNGRGFFMPSQVNGEMTRRFEWQER